MLVSHRWLSSGLAPSVEDPCSTQPCSHRVEIPQCLPPVTKSPVCPTSCTASALARETNFIFWFISKPRSGFLILLKNILKKYILKKKSTCGSEPYFFSLYVNHRFLKIRPSWAEKWRHWGCSAAMHRRGRSWLLGLMRAQLCSDFIQFLVHVR